MQLELSAYIEEDLEEIAEWIAVNAPRRAISFIREIRDEVASIGRAPLRYQLRPEIGESTRVSVVGKYVVLFRVDGEIVKIERIVFGGRDLSALLH